MMRPSRKLSPPALIIILSTIVRCLLSLLLNLGNDEVYYFTYAVQPDWNHFDHPPLIGLFIRLSTLDLQWINDFSMRLPAICGAAVNTWLIARCGQKIGNEQTGIFAAILYNTSIYTGIISGLFILPDSVQVVFWLAAICCMLALTDAPTATERNKLLIMLGIWIGLAILCKVHGVFLWIGFLGYLLFNKAHWFKNRYMYVAMSVTALLISPVILWNIHHQWISWTFHSDRVALKPSVDLISFFRTTLGQIAYQNPVNMVICILAYISISRNRLNIPSAKTRLLLWLAIPIIASTVVVSLFRPTLPHWSGPGFIAFNLLGACYLSSSQTLLPKIGKIRLLRASVALLVIVILSGSLLIKLYPGSLVTNKDPHRGTGDATLDLTGWETLRQGFEKTRDQDILQGHMQTDSPIITNKWFPAGHIYFYVAYPLKINIIGIGTLTDLHKFRWLNHLYPRISRGSNAYYITPSNNFTDPHTLYPGQFNKIHLVSKIPHIRNGKTARYWYVYHLVNALDDISPM
jgi:hypothetical protein